MSALDALLEERSKQKEKGAKKPRLVADPSISTQSIATCLRSYMEYKKSRDLCLSQPSTRWPNPVQLAHSCQWGLAEQVHGPLV